METIEKVISRICNSGVFPFCSEDRFLTASNTRTTSPNSGEAVEAPMKIQKVVAGNRYRIQPAVSLALPSVKLARAMLPGMIKAAIKDASNSLR